MKEIRECFTQMRAKGCMSIAVLLFLMMTALSGCATEDDNITLQNEISYMQAELDRLQDELSSLQEANNTPQISPGYPGNSPSLSSNSSAHWEYTYILGDGIANMIEEANRLGRKVGNLLFQAQLQVVVDNLQVD